jgi:hypothetical protein
MTADKVKDWLDSIFTLRELLSLTEDEMAQLEEIEGDLALQAAWWRRRRAMWPS